MAAKCCSETCELTAGFYILDDRTPHNDRGGYPTSRKVRGSSLDEVIDFLIYIILP
jgi:hypothetical protein